MEIIVTMWRKSHRSLITSLRYVFTFFILSFICTSATSCIEESEILGDWLECRAEDCMNLITSGYRFNNDGRWNGIRVEKEGSIIHVEYCVENYFTNRGFFEYKNQKLTLKDDNQKEVVSVHVKLNDGKAEMSWPSRKVIYLRNSRKQSGKLCGNIYQVEYQFSPSDFRYEHHCHQ